MPPATEPWFERAFGDLYPLIYPHRDDEAATMEVNLLVQALALPRGARVLDLCCGTGRHLRALRQLGFDAWGLDLSAPLLACACNGGADRLVRADVRALPFRDAFAAVLNLFTSFGYFENPADDERALRAMVAALQPRGVLVVDHIHPASLAGRLVPESVDRRGQATVTQRRRIEGGRVVKDVHVVFDDGRETSYTESVRLFEPEAFRSLLADAGLASVELWGDFDGTPLSGEQDRMIGVGRRGGA